MDSPIDILQHYWGHASFRPLQEEIVHSVLAGRDTLALLPTGGGKSICFQVPGLALPGLTIVISPLIALMRDQVDQLQRRDIPATFINSTLNPTEIDRKLQKAMDGQYKFLYLAPERLKTEIFLARLPKMQVSLIAVDEAHCVSQWGYDFRPSYLEVHALRELLPTVPMIALTATAPPSVRDDIAQKLQLRDPAIFTQSFRRANLHYVVEASERVAERILETAQRTPGTGIIYARTRKRVKAIAEYLQKNGVAAAAYHGGMTNSDRSAVQEAWLQNQVRVMAATNAFGMGIDKPDVRFVIHYNLPADPESYYQEAGRGGRDGQESLALAFANPQDRLELQEFVEEKYPQWEDLNRHFELLCNYYHVQDDAPPAGPLTLDLAAIAEARRVNPIRLYHSLQLLDQAGIVQLQDQPDDFAYLQVLVHPSEVLRYKERYPDMAFVIDHALRSLGGGIYQDAMRFVPIVWARTLGIELEKLSALLEQLAARGIVAYQAPTTKPTLQILTRRRRLLQAELEWERVEFLRQRSQDRLAAILRYSEYPGKMCRSRMLEAYFGETGGGECGKCDYCRAKAAPTGHAHIQSLATAILAYIGDLEVEMRLLVDDVQAGTRDERIAMVRELLDKGLLVRNGLKVARSKRP
jgi:ATP-dependent DNA helicase RecQ